MPRFAKISSGLLRGITITLSECNCRQNVDLVDLCCKDGCGKAHPYVLRLWIRLSRACLGKSPVSIGVSPQRWAVWHCGRDAGAAAVYAPGGFRCGKRLLLHHFLVQMQSFAKTGSGQTQSKIEEKSGARAGFSGWGDGEVTGCASWYVLPRDLSISSTGKLLQHPARELLGLRRQAATYPAIATGKQTNQQNPKQPNTGGGYRSISGAILKRFVGRVCVW